MTSHTFDAIIIGAGQAGPPLANRLSHAGQKVALVEREHFGGTCVNTGCMPTKTLVASAYAAHLARRGAEYGVTIPSPITINMPTAKARKDAVTLKARAGVEAGLRALETCTLFRGHARFNSAHEVQVGDDVLTAPQIFINSGARALVPDFPGVETVDCLTNTTILELDAVPRHLVVVGGSYIGLEFAQMYRRFGSEVTIVEKAPRLIQREDEDVSAAIQKILEREDIRVRVDSECISFAPHEQDISVGVSCKFGEPEAIGSHVLLAVGRRPNTDDLGLEKAGVEVDKRGYIMVDDELRTSAPGIWALGDCNGKGAFTHTAYNDFEIVAANLLDNDARRVSDRILSYGLYIDPPLGRVGMTETEARATGKSIQVATRPMTRVGRAVEKGETQGFMKVVVDTESRHVLGAAILGTGGDEVVHGFLDTMYAQAPYTIMQRSVPIHPTVSELLPTLLGDLKPA